MEFCELTLKTYIYRTWTPQIARDMPYFMVTLPPRMALAQLRGIMDDIASGLSFIHDQGQVHRDIKPANGISVVVETYSSPLLASVVYMETRRFRINRGRIF
jgi:serine/threonine protein kinase